MLNDIIKRLMERFSADSPGLAIKRFESHQQRLRSDFFTLAASQGKPRGLRWVRCDWLDERELLREKASGLLTLLAGINLHFEAVEGGDMEDVEAVGTVRDACAVFHYQKGRWGTGGRVLFNMHPQSAAVRLADSFHRVDVLD